MENMEYMEEKKRVPDYSRRAADKYRSARDTITFVTAAGTKNRIRAAIGDSASMAAYLSGLIESDLQSRATGRPAAAVNADLHRITLELDPVTWEKIRTLSGGDIGRFIDDAIQEALRID